MLCVFMQNTDIMHTEICRYDSWCSIHCVLVVWPDNAVFLPESAMEYEISARHTVNK